jgi:hypothetical protein
MTTRKPLPDIPNADPSNDTSDPTQITRLALTIPVMGGILMAQNWRKLGRPAWVGNTVLMYILVLMLVGLLLVVGIRLNRWLSPEFMIGVGVVLAIYVTFILSVIELQKQAYVHWRRTGTHDGQTFTFGATIGRTLAASSVLAAVIVGAVLFMNRTQTVSVPGISVSYRPQWEERSVSHLAVCSRPGNECPLGFRRATGSTVVNVLRYQVPGEESIEIFERETRDSYLRENPEIEIVRVEADTLSGLPAVRITEVIDPTLIDDGEMTDYVYGINVMVLHNGMVYEIGVNALSEGVFTENLWMIEELLDGIVLS